MSIDQIDRRLLSKAKKIAIERRFINIILRGSMFSVFIYIGSKCDYVLDLNNCSCPAFLFNVVLRKKQEHCYHILGLKYALEKDKIIKIELALKDLSEILSDIYTCGKSLKLRKIVSNLES
ncbi:hypothetical protein V6M85_11060 [Sulfolobus tengchongensis]|uniref:SWIM-type domain-containing protein n=1 Tax=Sulfolobus tengchongensis TaxID=207809 RepID=A0AAX4KYU0_9CREN